MSDDPRAASEPDVETKLARIADARLFYHNGPPLLTSYLDLVYADRGSKIGGTGQGFGGYGLGGEYAFRWINGVMECLGVDDWTQVKGKYVYADVTWSKVYRITSVETGKTFDPSLWADEAKDQK